MYRKIMCYLEAWKENAHRKPLILQGACVKIGLNQEKPYK
jgi:hypothetical protein